MCTGSQLTGALADAFESAFGRRILNYYGLTETTGICVSEGPFTPQPATQTIGKAVGCIAQVVDEQGKLVPHGVAGELRIFSENIMAGYFRQPKETAKVVRDGWFYTGDIAVMDLEGNLKLQGRKREIVKTSTEELIYLSEVEAIAQSLSWVKAAAACGFMEDDAEKMALFILCEPEQGNLTELKQSLSRQLGERRLPKLIRMKTEFPFGSNGKILKKQLLAELQDD